MLSVPAATPVTIPDDEPTVANVGLLLIQLPPDVASVSVVFRPTHTLVAPPIAAGKGFTVTGADLLQPVGMV